ncbi:MAG: spore germination protein [Candidatus Pelethousia sp.]|nr:spore germination protein [Candidatus Pelethousia sp.]
MLFSYMLRKLRFFMDSAYRRLGGEADGADAQSAPEKKIDKSLEENLEGLRALLSYSNDLVVHRFRFGPAGSLEAALVFIDGLVDTKTLTEAVLRPLRNWRADETQLPHAGDLLDKLGREALCAASMEAAQSLEKLSASCLQGNAVLLLEGCAGGLSIEAKGWEKRAVTEPQSETVVRGPREGFTENLRTNTALIRRKIHDGRLHVEQLNVGRKSHTGVCLLYLEGVVAPHVLEAVRYRVSRLDVESILETGYLEEYIEDAPYSPFATIGYSEKPDVVAAKILEGRVAIAVDGTPFVLTAPMLFIESFQTAEDYYTRPLYATLLRILRLFAYVLTVFGPSIYIALTAFHHELIPTTLLLRVASTREGTPFPVFLEALIMITAYEILREAGVRLPRAVGQAISIVGALIMGEAAVNAGIVGAPMVITIAVTAVAGFLVPSQADSSSMLRIGMMVPASFLGLYGVAFGFLALLMHLASLESFGVSYFDSFSHASDIQDTVIRTPLWFMNKRPARIAKGDTTRGHFFVPPLRPFASGEDGAQGGKP